MARSNTTKKTTRTTATQRRARAAASKENTAPAKSKKARLQDRLEATEGASLDQLATEFGWQPHTVRAAISGLRKGGLNVKRETGEVAPVYRIVAPGRS